MCSAEVSDSPPTAGGCWWLKSFLAEAQDASTQLGAFLLLMSLAIGCQGGNGAVLVSSGATV